MTDYKKRIAEVGFTVPGTGKVTLKGEYLCDLPCVSGDLCRAHDDDEGYRVGRILQIREEERDRCLSHISIR